MRRLLLAISILVSLNAAATAEDKMVVDMGKLTCRELTKLGFQDFAGITMWLSGYYNATVRRPQRVRTGRQDGEGFLPDQPALDRHVRGRAGARNQDASAALRDATELRGWRRRAVHAGKAG
jgi:HdeA/HdeB family